MSDDTVVPLPGVTLPAEDGEVRTDLVVELERFLAQAKRGEIIGMAAVFVRALGDDESERPVTCWTFPESQRCARLVVCGVAELAFDLQAARNRG